MASSGSPLPPLQTWWVLWCALLAGPFIILSIVPAPATPAFASSIPWQTALLPLAAGSTIRWTILPKISDGTRAFPLFIIGLALSEIPSLLGISLFLEVKRELFILTTLGMAQFIPIFAKRFYGEK